MSLTRRSFVAAAVGSLTAFSRLPDVAAASPRQSRDVEFAFRQYHNQTPASSLHMRLVQMWDGIAKESGGRVTADVVEREVASVEGGARYELGSPFTEGKIIEAVSKLRDLVALRSTSTSI